MAPPKKNVKMDLGAFLADDTFGSGSWADEEIDMSSIGVPVATAAPTYSSARREAEFGGGMGGFERRREEYPVPDAPPYRARINNLPYEVDEESLARFFEDRLQAPGCVSDISVPLDQMTNRAKGFAFVTFTERDILEESLNLTLAEFNGRKIFVNVAAPQKQDVFDMDWSSVRGSGTTGGRGDRFDRGDRGDRPPREEVELDWSSARGSAAPRERNNRYGGDRPPRREEPDLDWGSARSTAGTLPPRERSERRERSFEHSERPPRREEPDLDWGSARSTTATLPPRERSNRAQAERTQAEGLDRPERRPKRDEPELDWGAARSTATKLPPRERSSRTERTEKVEKKDDFDWKRGQALEPRPNANRRNSKQQKEKESEKPQGPQKSLYDVLAVDGDSDDEEEKPKEAATKTEDKETGLEEATSKLNVQEESKDDDGWEVVGK